MKTKFGRFLNIVVALALVATILLPSAAFAQKRSDAPTIAEAATSLPQFSTLATLLDLAGLVDLVDGKQHFTVFAPTNQAFDDLEEAYDGITACLTDEDNLDLLQSVLAFHVTRGDRYSQSLFPDKGIMMLNGATAMTSLDNGPMISGANIIDPFDVRVSNGVIHAIDAVIVDDATFGSIVDTCF